MDKKKIVQEIIDCHRRHCEGEQLGGIYPEDILEKAIIEAKIEVLKRLQMANTGILLKFKDRVVKNMWDELERLEQLKKGES